MYSRSCATRPLSNSRTFHCPQKTLVPVLVTPVLPFPRLLADTHLLSVSVDVTIVDILYKWHHTICGLLLSCLECFYCSHCRMFIHTVAYLNTPFFSTSFLLMAEKIPLCHHSRLCIRQLMGIWVSAFWPLEMMLLSLV